MAGTTLFQSEIFEHHIPDVPHPERPERLLACRSRLQKSGLLNSCTMGKIAPAPVATLELCHAGEVIDFARQECEAGGGYLDPDTPVSSQSFEIACLAAGAAVNAVDAVMSEQTANAFCLIRPPGHHATPSRSMGFCLFNNIAIAARHAMEKFGVTRVLIVDWDVHHGNGTQDCFYEDPRVSFFSAHRFPFYPGTGRESERGSGAGSGYTFNLPVRFGTQRTEYLKSFASVLEQAAEKIRPELVLLSAGFDAHRADPIGSLGLEIEDFEELGALVHGVARTHCHGKLVSLLEGGYNIEILAECVEMHLRQMIEQGELT